MFSDEYAARGPNGIAQFSRRFDQQTQVFRRKGIRRCDSLFRSIDDNGNSVAAYRLPGRFRRFQRVQLPVNFILDAVRDSRPDRHEHRECLRVVFRLRNQVGCGQFGARARIGHHQRLRRPVNAVYADIAI